MSTAYSRLALGLLASAALAACAANPSPEGAAAADTTAGVMAAPAADSAARDSAMRDSAMKARADTAMMPPDTAMMPDTSRVPPDTAMMPPDTAAVPPDTSMVPPARDTSMMSPGDTTMMPRSDTSMAMAGAGATATVQMQGPAGRDLGTLTLTQTGGGIAISGRLTGLAPGEHGFHVHTAGKCDGPSFETAGPHWNPTNRGHGVNNPAGPHFGDLTNLMVGEDSSVTVQATTPAGTMNGENSLLDGDGAAVVIHAEADDYQSNPSGNAGNRIACGVVKGRM